ncbi:hypothetical protein GGI23_000560 [Coemansia sp. RSA 2559]|nr:hypothetical protein GGI23_000560 [Coemansia sp. RSA 2559]KAJ2869188.1 hypothetical protein GGI22_000403 [Coemansia erecta]
MPLQASPVMHGSPLQSPLSTGTDVLDQTTVNAFAAAAAAAAVAASTSSLPSSIESISPELLASVISSGVCAYGSALVEPQELLPPAASEISMLAALPFTSIAMPAANIAPQKTLSVSHTEEPTVPDVAASYVSHPVVSSQPLPPSKRQRRSVPSLRKASSRQGVLEPSIAGVENASGCSSSSSNQSSSTGTAASSASRKCATKSAASEKGSQPKTAVPHTLPSRPIAPSSSSGNGSHSMVPLAPRQPATQSPSSVPDIRKKQKLQPKDSAVQNEDKKVANTCLSSGLSSSSSGSSTPPGLSVLAKIAQKQVPIRVKEEEEVMNAANQQNTYQGRLIAPSPARRQTRSPSLPPVKAEAALSPATNSADSTVQKRQERLIKNRAAALLSRKRKRDYMTKLESEVEDLRTSNTTLIKRMEDMERAMKALAEERDRLRDENEAARVLASATTPSTGTTASASAANNNSSNVTTEKSEEKAKEQGESSEANDGKGGDAVEASDGTMDIDGPLSGGEVFGQQQRGGANSKQRTAGALLMAMLFSFSLFTLPSMYTSSNQITAGGPQSAGIIPIRSLPSPEPRLLIGSGKTSDNAAEPPLIERVRRSITALTQQAGPNQANDEPQYANGSDSSGNWMRPMTMEESAELHAWIRHGLTPKDKSTSAIAPRGDSARRVPKVVVEHVKESTARAGSVPNSLSVVHQQMHEANDYAMLYCPTMQHVVFGGDSLETADMNGYLSANNNGGGNNAPLVYSPSAPRVIDTAKQQQQQQQQQKQQASEGDSDTVAVVHGGRMMDDVDSEVIASPRVADWHTEASSHADLVPTHVGKSMFAAASSNRPKLSLYSPIVGGGGGGSSNSISSSNGGGEILPPWDEYARLAASAGESEEQQAAELAADNRQKYLRIDVEVVGSRWVTADKFAHGLY